MAIKLSNKGFTLLEVLVATAIFAFFIAAFSSRHSANVLSSNTIREDLILKELCLKALNETMLDPPKFSTSITLAPEAAKVFDDFPDYEYVIEWKEFDVKPVISMLLGAEEKESAEENATKQALQRLEKPIVENLKKQLWQLKITVTNKNTGYFQDLTTWVYDEKAQVKLKI
ncbi:MAG: prepilin-type N-terminal cleavage/methylation domain-containing protein [Halobacteriovoraceae bacterium]|nr:prepilin-type N-terminal cleavage/methylation domain-containing protein [Halobacteriovoraceae bacterium]